MNEAKERFEDLLEMDQSDPDVQYELGQCYLTGTGVEKNVGEAERWLRRAAEQGHEEAAALLLAAEQDQAAAEDVPLTEATLPDWCLRAEEGDVEAQFQVASYFLEGGSQAEQEEAERYLDMAVEQGKPEACLLLAKRRLSANKPEQAVKLLNNAAECGLWEAAQLLGDCCSQGLGTDRNVEAAEHWYVQAAERGSGELRLQLALRYAKGDGVPQSRGKAYNWVKKAQDAGCPDAKARFDSLYDQYVQEQKRKAEAAEAERQRREKEEAERRAAEEAERQRREKEEAQRKAAAEAEWRRQEQEEARQKEAAEAERRRQAAEAERRWKEERRLMEAERRRVEEEQLRKEEEERRKKARRQALVRNVSRVVGALVLVYAAACILLQAVECGWEFPKVVESVVTWMLPKSRGFQLVAIFAAPGICLGGMLIAYSCARSLVLTLLGVGLLGYEVVIFVICFLDAPVAIFLASIFGVFFFGVCSGVAFGVLVLGALALNRWAGNKEMYDPLDIFSTLARR